MSLSEVEMFQNQQRSNWVRLRTLVTLRWFAVAGQSAAILVTVLYYRVNIEVGMATVIIGSSIAANLFFSFLYPGNRRLSEREAALTLAFDIGQLGLLLFITGGLNNPFALLILGPVTIAATVLHLRSTILIGVIAIVTVTVLARWNLPLLTASGQMLLLPNLFLFGFWIALVIGVVFLGIYARQVTTEMHNMGEALVATQLVLAREQKLTDLDGVVAATAHELGTPLATIKLVSSELHDELTGQPELQEDAALIRQQAIRCSEILRSMGRAGKDDLHLRHAPLETVVREAAEPHLQRGKAIFFVVIPPVDGPTRQPMITRRPEIIHGLRNLIQNAVDFAEAAVEVEASWTAQTVTIRIADDGPGFTQSVLGRIGDPFMRSGKAQDMRQHRPGYEGMGLGLFIAKALLERSGATLSFANGGESGSGAIVLVKWPRARVSLPQESEPLGVNPPMRA